MSCILGMQNVNTTRLDAEKNFKTIIELFKKSFLESLHEDEARTLEKLLENPFFARIHEKMKKGELIEEGEYNQSRFSCQKAFRDFERRTQHQQDKRPILLRRLSPIAAVLIIGITISLFFLLSNKQEERIAQIPQTISPGSNKAQIQLENGDIVILAGNTLQVEEEGGINIKYENGTVSYTSQKTETNKLTTNELTVPAGGECFLVFDDGTKVWLNSVTKLKYPTKFTGEERKIYLEGEAYFDVTPDSKPFIVQTSRGEVKVLGTTFGIKAYTNEAMATTLVSGRVVYQGADTVQLVPGEQVVVAPTNGEIEKHVVDVEEYVGWKNGVYLFNKRSLGDIMKDFERWYNVKITFRNEKLRDLLFSGDVDRYDNINTFLELLENTEEVRYKIKDKQIELY